MRLRNLIILTVIVPLFVILVVFSLVAIKSLEDNVRSKLQTEVEIITRTLSSSLSYAVTPDSNTPLEEALQSAFSFHRIYGVYVFDTEGRDIYGLGLGKDIFSREEIQQIIERDDLYSNYRQHDGWNYYSALTPLRSQDGTVYGVLQVNRLNTGIENYTGFISIVAVLVFVVGAAGIVFSIWWGFRRHIERPLNRLLHVMQLVEKGDRSQRATEDGPIEYRHLASGLNGMLDAMAEKDQEIENRQRREIELEKRLRKSKKLAELGVLAAGVAHEIGAPLTVINGIRGEVERIVEIVRQLMELGRQHNVEKGELALDQLIMSASGLVEDELEPRNIRLDIELPSPTPNLLANGQQIVQVLTNLLRNAAQAPEVSRIRVHAQQQEHELILWVEDDGPGIPNSHHHKVFDPFFTTKPVGQGSGLGLSMVHRIINDHGGTIGVFDSALGGAGFEITLPISETASA